MRTAAPVSRRIPRTVRLSKQNLSYYIIKDLRLNFCHDSLPEQRGNVHDSDHSIVQCPGNLLKEWTHPFILVIPPGNRPDQSKRLEHRRNSVSYDVEAVAKLNVLEMAVHQQKESL